MGKWRLQKNKYGDGGRRWGGCGATPLGISSRKEIFSRKTATAACGGGGGGGGKMRGYAPRDAVAEWSRRRAGDRLIASSNPTSAR